MDYEQGLVPIPSDVHRFFPEWADRPQSADRLLEADHNSYLAGGYSEEFGYRVRPGLPADFQPLEGDPDQSGQWGVQIDCLHPGYPECPRPADRGTQRLDFEASRRESLPPLRGSESVGRTPQHEGAGRVLQVDRSGADRHGVFGLPIGTLWLRLRIRARFASARIPADADRRRRRSPAR